MTKQTLVSILAAICGVVSVPNSVIAQEVLRGEANLLHRAPIEYPVEAVAKRIQGTVVVEATLNERGVVADAHVVSGPEPLRRTVLKSVLDWHYAAQTQSPVEVAIDFKLPLKNVLGGVPGGVPSAAAAESGKLNRIQMSAIAEPLREALANRLPVRVGDEIQPDILARVRQAVRDVDEHLDVRLTRAPITSENIEGGRGYVLTIFSTAPMVVPNSGSSAQRIRVGGNAQAAMVINAPKPVYPPLAKQSRIQGTVRMNVTINKDGTVQDVEVASGHPLLVPAAVDAVRQWVYRPTVLNGQAIPVMAPIEVNFILSQ